jgi:hypothetical protein
MEPVIVAKVIRIEKQKELFVSSVSQKFLLTLWNDGVVLTKNVNDT